MLLPAGLSAGLQPVRLLTSGLSQPEIASLSAAASHLAGLRLELLSTPLDCRVGLFEGFEPDDPVLSSIREALDGSVPLPLLISGCADLTETSTLQNLVRAELSRHISSYGLRKPIEPCAVWPFEAARVVAHRTLDGAVCTYGDESWWDVSEVVTLDGVVDEELRASLLSLLAGAGWDPEQGPDSRLWERGIFGDVSESEDADVGESATQSGAGWGLREEVVERLCAEPPPPAIAALQAKMAWYLRINPTPEQA